MKWQERIVVDPEIMAGKPVVKGTRLAVEYIVDLLAQGWPQTEILRNYPGLSQLRQCGAEGRARVSAAGRGLADARPSSLRPSRGGAG